MGLDAIGKLADGMADAEGPLMDIVSGIVGNVQSAIRNVMAIPEVGVGDAIALPTPVNPSSSKIIPITNATQQQTVTTTPAATAQIEQNLTIISPEPLSPSETARLNKNASRQLAMDW